MKQSSKKECLNIFTYPKMGWFEGKTMKFEQIKIYMSE